MDAGRSNGWSTLSQHNVRCVSKCSWFLRCDTHVESVAPAPCIYCSSNITGTLTQNHFLSSPAQLMHENVRKNNTVFRVYFVLCSIEFTKWKKIIIINKWEDNRSWITREKRERRRRRRNRFFFINKMRHYFTWNWNAKTGLFTIAVLWRILFN